MHGDVERQSGRTWLHRGRVLGSYRVEHVLGEGGMALVVAATDLRTQRKVALKVPHAERCSARDLERFEREARFVERLIGPHVPRVYEFTTLNVDSAPVPAIVFEYLEGSDLATWLATHGPLDIPTAARIGIQSCCALAEAHALDLVHRDIKPANLFLTTTSSGPIVKVLDFGISRSRTSKVTTGAVLGSPAYMPPERMRPSMTVDARGDLWSLGVVLFEALAGHLPFESDVFPDLCLKILMDDPPPLPEVPADLARVIFRCLEKQPEARFQTAAELIEALRPFATDVQLALRPSPRRRKRTVPVLAATLGIAVIAGLWLRPGQVDALVPAQPREDVPVTSISVRVTRSEAVPSISEVRRHIVVPRLPTGAVAETVPIVPVETASAAAAEPDDPLASPF